MPSGADAQHAEKDGAAKLPLRLLDELIAHLPRYWRGTEKMLMAFFRISLSWRRTSTSRRSRASSSSCGWPWPGKARWPFCSASFFQRPGAHWAVVVVEAQVTCDLGHAQPTFSDQTDGFPFELAAVLPPTDCFLLNSHDCSCG